MKTLLTQNWNNFLDRFDNLNKDIYFYEEYVKLYETEDEKAFCAVCYENSAILLMPFIRRKIGDYYDFETAYGYGGLISNIDDVNWIENAIEEMEKLLVQENYVCGFLRFHCLLENAEFCKKHFQVIFDRNTVAINTALPEEEIWFGQITSKNRNMIRKAEKNGLIYKTEHMFDSLEEFIKLYNATMKRLGADDFYFFNKQYYYDFVERFKGSAFLGTVRKGEKLLGAALFMYSSPYGHYHLEGSDREYSSLGVNNLLLWKSAVEMHNLGVKEFHLGGGNNSASDNSLLKFKKSFSNNLKNFYIGKWIFNEEKYFELKQSWVKKNPDKVEKYGNLLLCYRF